LTAEIFMTLLKLKKQDTSIMELEEDERKTWRWGDREKRDYN
jgi:hypothetical protein